MMRLLLGLILALFVGAAEAHVSAVPFPEVGSLEDVTHQAAYSQVQTYAVPAIPQIFYNIVTDGGATCNGSGDDAPNFKTFNTWARANQGTAQVVLTVPNGSNCVFNSNQTITGANNPNMWAFGINNMIVEGVGATLTAGSSGFRLGGNGMCYAGLASASGCSARLQTAMAGATQVVLTSASLAAGYISRFAVGKRILLGGLDIQGQWNIPYGDPPNQQFFEWKTITGINVGTGAIDLDAPLTNTYRSTWPNYNSGDNFHSDAAGPATIWALPDSWNVTVEYRGLTINQSGQTYAEARNVIYRGVTFLGANGGIPSQNETFTATGGTNWPTAIVEVDKFIGTMTLDGVSIYRIDFQSPAPNVLVMNNSAVTNAMFGSAKSSQVTDTSFATLRVGAYTYGVSTGDFVCTRCNVTLYDQTGGIAQDSRNPSEWSMSGGVITYANTAITGDGPLSRIMVPGANIWFNTNGGDYSQLGGTFQVLGVTQDATNTYVQTSLPGSQPPIANFSGASYVTLRSVSVPRFTCIDCTGDAYLVAGSSQKGAPALIPPFSYGRQAYAPTASGGLQGIKANGNLTSITVDVTQAFTGSGGGTLNLAGQFHNFAIKQSDWSPYDWVPTINLKQAGTRVITGSSVTCNGSPGACSGDTNLTLPEAIWIQDGIYPFMVGNLSGGGTLPLFTITAQTNQQVVP